jgi:protein-tyrosine phosphatase
MIKVLFVCLGNICRSPLAEGVFRQKTIEQDVSHLFHVDSAGTASYHIGALPDERSRAVVLKRGFELTHKARAFNANDFSEFNYIIAMDKNNLNNIKRLMPDDTDSKVLLMRHFDLLEKDGEVPDPYYGDMKDFEHVYDILNRSCDVMLGYLMDELSAAGK